MTQQYQQENRIGWRCHWLYTLGQTCAARYRPFRQKIRTTFGEVKFCEILHSVEHLLIRLQIDLCGPSEKLEVTHLVPSQGARGQQGYRSL